MTGEGNPSLPSSAPGSRPRPVPQSRPSPRARKRPPTRARGSGGEQDHPLSRVFPRSPRGAPDPLAAYGRVPRPGPGAPPVGRGSASRGDSTLDSGPAPALAGRGEGTKGVGPAADARVPGRALGDLVHSLHRAALGVLGRQPGAAGPDSEGRAGSQASRTLPRTSGPSAGRDSRGQPPVRRGSRGGPRPPAARQRRRRRRA